MRFIFSILLLVGSVGASAVELSAASNREILQELARRLQGGGGTATPTSVSYLCESSGYLKIEAITAAGEVKNESKYLSTQAQCEDQAKLLRQNKAKIYDQTIFALCENSGYLLKLSINLKGEIKQLSSNYLSTYAACLPQAKETNGQP